MTEHNSLPVAPEDAMKPPTPGVGHDETPETAVVTPDYSNPPWLNIPGVYNFREVGGYPIPSSTGQPRSFRKGLIYRSAEPSKITEEGRKKLQSLGVRTVFDLRSEAEIKRLEGIMPTIEIESVERVFVPVFSEESDHAPEVVEQRYKDYASGNLERAYASVLKAGGSSYRVIIQRLLSDPKHAILLHCTAGKDRTGVFCGILLQLAGVPDDIIAAEYALTTVGLGSVRKTILGYLRKTKPYMSEELRDVELGDEGAENMMSSREDSMRKTLHMLREQFGGPEQYLKDYCKLTDEEIGRLREILVSDEEPSMDLERLKRALKVGE